MQNQQSLMAKLEILGQYSFAIKTANNTGKLGRLTINKHHRAKTPELAYLFIVLEQYGHHLAAVTAGRLSVELPMRSRDNDVSKLRNRVRGKFSHMAKQLYHFFYPRVGEVNPGPLWDNAHPWICDGIRAENALVECAAVLMQLLPKYAYYHAEGPMSDIFSDVLEVVITTCFETVDKRRVFATRDNIHLKYPIEWLHEVEQTIVPFKSTLPHRTVKPPSHIYEALQLAAITIDPEVTEGEYVETPAGMLVNYEQCLYILNSNHLSTELFKPSEHFCLK